mmetsp:Transcript_66623/g.192425  ORF Transcript_66623/g.192425 Transcript_66623/m.192425 type:complete len:788 (+) Transcript_66623:110-2473(+)
MGCGPSRKSQSTGGKDSSSKKDSKGATATASSNGKLLDKYVLGEVLGQGAFGVVYRCTKKDDSTKEFAVKMIDQVETPLAEIKREAEMLHKLSHPTVIKLHDVYYEKVFVCMVLEYYKGGDMIQGMMAHWKSKGMIPIWNVKHLSKQMHTAVAWLHSKSCVHRDIKGDNYMMDKPNVENPQQRLYLSDFGTVREVAPGERMTQKCGTKNYWSPEFYKMNYGLKVDCWAVGVVTFGLYSAKFPFKNHEEVKSKKLAVSSRVDKSGADLVTSSLERCEEKRIEAKDAVRHPFIADIENFGGGAPLEPEKAQAIQTDLKESGANAGIQERRRELVDRLKQAHGEKPVLRDDTHDNVGIRRKQIDDLNFVVIDSDHDRSIKYSWWEAKDTEDMQKPFFKARPMSATSRNDDVDTRSVEKLLVDHNISLDKFGLGQAKSFEEFVGEIQKGQSRLQLDASKHKHIVRVVDVVALRLEHGTGAQQRYLIEVSMKYPDGRIRNDTNQMPGDKKAPQENAIRAATRLLDQLGMSDVDVAFDPANTETFEQIEDSPSYPGVQTVYRKEILAGTVKSTDPKVLQRLGLAPSGGKFVSSDGKGYETTYAWLTQAECTSKGIKTSFPHDGSFSTLVYPPLGLEVEELEEFMQTNKVDTSRLGTGVARSLQDFSEELVKGEATLHKMPNGQIKRIVDVVIVKIVRKNGDVIVEAEEAVKDSKQVLQRLPAVKRRHDEHQFLAARRLIMRYLRINENCIKINETDVRVVEEETESKSYPGLSTIYRKRFITAEMTEEAFITC